MVFTFVVAAGIVLGMADTLLNDRLGLGEHFRRGFTLLGAMMMTMSGIMAISPVIAKCLSPVIVPVFEWIGIDPAVFAVIMGSDMGGYQLAMSLCKDPVVGFLAGGIIAGMIGGTLNFIIPMGYSLVDEEVIPYFSQGLLIGVCAIPFGGVLAGLLMGLSVSAVFLTNLPILFLSGLISIAFALWRTRVIRVMVSFGKILGYLGVIGVGVGCFTHLTGITLIPGLTPITETMTTVCEVTITMLGMLPILELVQKVFRRVLIRIGGLVGIDSMSCISFLVTLTSTTPVYGVMKDMNRRGIVMNAAWMVCCASGLGSQLGLVMNFGPEYLVPYLAAKLGAGLLAVLLAVYFTRNMNQQETQ